MYKVDTGSNLADLFRKLLSRDKRKKYRSKDFKVIKQIEYSRLFMLREAF